MKNIVEGFRGFWNETKETTCLFCCPLFLPFLVLFLIYVVSLYALFRADFNYIDDLGRTADGYRSWNNWSRYISTYLSVIVHAESKITDISPLPQLMGVALIVLASLIVIKIFSERKTINGWEMLAAIPIGLSPYFLECLSYKFDSPYMALSVLASVFPFLFWKAETKLFCAISVIGILTMCMTYQASSGIYAMMGLFLAGEMWRQGRPLKETVRFLEKAVGSYLVSLLFFRVALMKSANEAGYTGTDVAHGADAGARILHNLASYFHQIYADSAIQWLALAGLIVFLFIVSFAVKANRNKICAILVAVVLVVVGACISYGGYVLLQTPMMAPRAMYGIGFLFSLMALQIVQEWKLRLPSKIIVALLGYCFIVFASTYGNALAEQQRFIDYRVELVLADLGHAVPDNNKEIAVQLDGNIGKSPVVSRMAQRVPVLNRLVAQSFGGGWYWNEHYFFRYFGLKKVKPIRGSHPNPDLRKLNLPTVVDSRFHTIRSDGEHILISLK